MSQFDVCIRGGGIVGRSLALLLARERLRVGLVDRNLAAPQAASETRADVRAYALNRASRDLLERVRAWPEDERAATPVLRMQVQGDAQSQLHFDAATLGSDALTWIVDVPALEQRLAEAVRYQPQIEVLSEPAKAKLTVVCEGRASRTREEFGVEFEVFPYGQHALATRMSTERPHGQVARQWFANGDILALLPLDGPQGHTVAVVWSTTPERAATLRTQEPAAFEQALAQACHHELGAMSLQGERQSWALQKAQARQWIGSNAQGAWALAGDAAHNVHPLAGQGLNLGLADVAELIQVLTTKEYWREVSDVRVLRRYERARKAGMLLLDAGMDSLQRLYAYDSERWGALRAWGLRGVEHSGWIKHWLARRAMSF